MQAARPCRGRAAFFGGLADDEPGALTGPLLCATLPPPMRAYDLIRKKRDGLQLDPDELRFLVRGATDGSVADEQLSAFLMAVR